MPKARFRKAHVYFNKLVVHVAANIDGTDYRCGPSLPVQSISYPPSAPNLGDALLQTLRREVPIVPPEVFDYECQKALNQLSASGFDELERKFWYVLAHLDQNNQVILTPTQKAEKGGYVFASQTEPIPVSNSAAIGELLYRTILNQDEHYYTEEESHS